MLGINVPFLRLAEQLGLGDFANRSVEYIKYMEFLENFRPAAPRQNSMGKTVLSPLVELLFNKRVELVSLFRYFDAEKTGTISIDEFKKGVASLIKIANNNITSSEIDRLAEEIDLLNGLFFYEDYFNNYAPQELAPSKRPKRDMRRARSIRTEQMALGVMMIDGLEEDVFGKSPKVIPRSPSVGINTLVSRSMGDRKEKRIVLPEMRTRSSIDDENGVLSGEACAAAAVFETLRTSENDKNEVFITVTDEDGS